MPAAYDNGWMRVNWIGHLVTNWAGDWGFVRSLDVRLSQPNYVGDTTWCSGRVTRKLEVDGEKRVEIACWGENQLGEKTTEALVGVRLPTRNPADRYLF
jgi:hypothetical protein